MPTKHGFIVVSLMGLVFCQNSEPGLATQNTSESFLIEVGILLILALLVVSCYTGYILHKFHVEYLFESGAAIIWGIIIGAIIRLFFWIIIFL